MKKILSLAVLASLSLLFHCSSEDEPSGPESIVITGEYQGRLTLSSGEQGIVLYRFESLGNSVYRGFYEGIEFGEITVTTTQITGVPTNGNQAFASLVGAVSETNIGFSLLDAQGNQVGVFGGNKVTASEKASASIEISNKDYIIIDDFCAFGPGGYGVTNEYERLGGVERKVFFTFTFSEEPSSGSYTATSGSPSSSSFSGDISYLGEFLDAISGSCSVTNSGSGLSVQIDGVTFETSSDGAVEATGSLVCGG